MERILNNVCGFQIFKFDEFNITLNNNSDKDKDKYGGDIVNIFGPSGSGKTSFFRGIVLALLPYYNFKISDNFINNNDTLRYLNKYRTNGETVKKELKEKEYLYSFLDEMFNYDRSYILINLGDDLNLIMYPRSQASYEYNKFYIEGDIGKIHNKLLESLKNEDNISIEIALENLKKDGLCKIIELGDTLTKFYNKKEEKAIIGIGDRTNYENLILLLLENMGDNDKIIDKTLLTTLAQDLIKDNEKNNNFEKSENIIDLELYVKDLFDSAIKLEQSSLVNTKETNEFYTNLINLKKDTFIELNKFYIHYNKFLNKHNETNYEEKIELLNNNINEKEIQLEAIINSENEDKNNKIKIVFNKEKIEKEFNEFKNHKTKIIESLTKEFKDLNVENYDIEYEDLNFKLEIDLKEKQKLENSKKDDETKLRKIKELQDSKNQLINKEKEFKEKIIVVENKIKELENKLNKKVIHLFNDIENKISMEAKTLLLSLNIDTSYSFENDEINLLNDISSSLININKIGSKLKEDQENYIKKNKFEVVSIEDIRKELEENNNNLKLYSNELSEIIMKKDKKIIELNDFESSNYNEKRAIYYKEILETIASFNHFKNIDFEKDLFSIEEELEKINLLLLGYSKKRFELEPDIKALKLNKEKLELELQEINKIITQENKEIFDSFEDIDDIFDENIELNDNFNSYVDIIKNKLLISFNKSTKIFDIKKLIKTDINLLPDNLNDICGFYKILENLINSIENIKKSFTAEISNFANDVRTKRGVIEKLEGIEKQQIKKCEKLLKQLEKTNKQGGSIKLKFETNEVLSNYSNKILEFLKELDELENDDILTFLNKKDNTLNLLSSKVELLNKIIINSKNEGIIDNKPLFINKVFVDIEGSKGNYTALESFIRNEIFQLLHKDINNYVSLPMVIDESASIDKSFKKEVLLELDYKGPKVLLAASEDIGNNFIDSIIRFIPCEKKIIVQQLKKIDGTLKDENSTKLNGVL